MPWLKQNYLNSHGTKHFALSEAVMSGSVNVENSLSLDALIVAKSFAVLTGTSQNKLQEGVHTNKHRSISGLTARDFPHMKNKEFLEGMC
jgi:hypothetical protein